MGGVAVALCCGHLDDLPAGSMSFAPALLAFLQLHFRQLRVTPGTSATDTTKPALARRLILLK